jgi:hypothetical protein
MFCIYFTHTHTHTHARTHARSLFAFTTFSNTCRLTHPAGPLGLNNREREREWQLVPTYWTKLWGGSMQIEGRESQMGKGVYFSSFVGCRFGRNPLSIGTDMPWYSRIAILFCPCRHNTQDYNTGGVILHSPATTCKSVAQSRFM